MLANKTTVITHKPVLLKEVLRGMAIKPDDIVLDGTINRGGHSAAICELLSSKGTLVGIDKDFNALKDAKTNLINCKAKTYFVEENYANFDIILAQNQIEKVDKIILDLGYSSEQIDRGERGFSFKYNEPLVMTYEVETKIGGITAWNVVNEWEEDSLSSIFEGFGEEKFALRIAKHIVSSRKNKSINTSTKLAEIVKASVPKWYARKKIHPATKTFQAIRIAVNRELQSLEEVLPKSIKYLNPNGRIAIISFHSLEDRIVKKYFNEERKKGVVILITKKPITATVIEKQSNPRSRSAKLRIAMKK